MSQTAAAAVDPVDDVDLTTWGDNIRDRRMELGLTQTQLALRLSLELQRRVTQSRVSEFEQGRTRPHDQMRIALCHVLDVPLPDLLPFPPDVQKRGRSRG